MKNVYLFQPTYLSSNSISFPYAIGAWASYAWNFEDIQESYALSGIFFLREITDKVISQIEQPFLAGFSCYMWNTIRSWRKN